jgi:hypothetical protein
MRARPAGSFNRAARAGELARRAAMAPERRPLSLLGEYWTVAVDLVHVGKLVRGSVGGRRERGTVGRGGARGDVASE